MENEGNEKEKGGKKRGDEICNVVYWEQLHES